MHSPTVDIASHVGPPRVRASAAIGLCDMLRRDGGNPREVLGRTGLREDDLNIVSSWLALSAYCDVLERASAYCGSSAFGLKLGLGRHADLLGDLGVFATSAPTLKAALTSIAGHFWVLQERTAVTLSRREGDIVLAYQIRDGHIVKRRQDAELTIGALIGCIRLCLGGQWVPKEVHFEHARPSSVADHDALIGGPVYFGQSRNAIVLTERDLGASTPAPDPARCAAFERRLEGRLLSEETRSCNVDFVGIVLQEIRDGFVRGALGADHVARKLNLSAPALYRRLKACGVEFSELQRDLRLELALSYVSEPHLPLTEIALALGYSELSAFSRAFRAWTGVAPNVYRQRVSHLQD